MNLYYVSGDDLLLEKESFGIIGTRYERGFDGNYILADSPGQAKSTFMRDFNEHGRLYTGGECEYTELRCKLVARNVVGERGVCQIDNLIHPHHFEWIEAQQ